VETSIRSATVSAWFCSNKKAYKVYFRWFCFKTNSHNDIRDQRVIIWEKLRILNRTAQLEIKGKFWITQTTYRLIINYLWNKLERADIWILFIALLFHLDSLLSTKKLKMNLKALFVMQSAQMHIFVPLLLRLRQSISMQFSKKDTLSKVIHGVLSVVE